MWKDVITTLFKIRSLNFHEGTGENHKYRSHVFPGAHNSGHRVLVFSMLCRIFDCFQYGEVLCVNFVTSRISNYFLDFWKNLCLSRGRKKN